MADISAALVKELREQTGAGMMDCKRALEETGGDLDAAEKLLREKGIAQAAKRSGRETTEGKVAIELGDDEAAMVAVGCETEPVSNNDEFLVFVERVLDAVEHRGPDAVAELEDERVALAAKLGENIVVRDAVCFKGEEGDVLSGYVHTPARKIGVAGPRTRKRGRRLSPGAAHLLDGPAVPDAQPTSPRPRSRRSARSSGSSPTSPPSPRRCAARSSTAESRNGSPRGCSPTRSGSTNPGRRSERS